MTCNSISSAYIQLKIQSHETVIWITDSYKDELVAKLLDLLHFISPLAKNLHAGILSN